MEFQIRSFLTIFLLNIFISCSISQWFGVPDCVTAREESGNCKKIHDCPHMLNIMNMISSHGEYEPYLNQSRCLNTGKSQDEIIICCPTRPLQLSNEIVNLTYNSLLPKHCRNVGITYIALGISTRLDEYPWMVQLIYDRVSESKCSGSLISESYVLTAAHCFPDYLKATSVKLGEHDTSTEKDCLLDGSDEELRRDSGGCADPVVTVGIEKIITHENFGNNNGVIKNDIALVRLVRPVTLTKYIQPICLPTNANIEQRLFTAGWGLTELGEYSEKKLKVEITNADMDMCSKKFKPFDLKSVFGIFCTEGENGAGNCVGDSGGPVMAETSILYHQEWILFGIHSFGSPYCAFQFPHFHTKVHDFMPWILSHMSV